MKQMKNRKPQQRNRSYKKESNGNQRPGKNIAKKLQNSQEWLNGRVEMSGNTISVLEDN